MTRVAGMQPGGPTADKIRLLLVDDHDLVVMAMTAAFEDVSDIELVATAGSIEDAVTQTARHQPDVVLLDRRLPDGDGIGAIGRLMKQGPDLRVLLFTASADEAIVARVAEAGGAGVLLKAGLLADIVDTIQSVAAGKSR